MGTPWPENQCAHRKRKIEKLIKDQAQDTTAQLQILFEKPTGDHDGLEKLLEKRFISFTESLSHVSLCRCNDCECEEVTQIPNRVGSPISDQISVDFGKGKRPAAEDRRGSNERSFSSETISTQNTTSTPSFAAPDWREEKKMEEKKMKMEEKKLEEKKKEEPALLVRPRPYQIVIGSPSFAAPDRRGEKKMEEKKMKMEEKKLEDKKKEAEPALLVRPRPYQIVIGSLKRLTHLDISKCYYRDHMPKEISSLLGLEVLEGFVVGNSMEKEKDSCTLEHLEKLTKLRALSIYTKREDFPVISDLRDLNRLKRLHKLRIQWGGVSVHKSENISKVDNSSEESSAVESTKQENHGHADTKIACNTFFTVILSHLFATLSLLPVENDASPELPPQLEELHLYDLPRTSAPDWLRPSKRNKIKKLHIGGGPLSDLGRLALQEKSEWQVEMLSLVFLKDLEMNWTDLRKLFPKLIYFEKVSCPKLQFSPCDGAWMNEPSIFSFDEASTVLGVPVSTYQAWGHRAT